MKKLSISFVLLCSSFLIWSNEINPFPFNHYKLTENSIISAAKLNSKITEKDRIIVSKDGHLEANGKRIRIFGTNLSEIPSKRNAAFVAKSLANRGYNCVRFHHVDASWSNCFLRKNGYGKWVINEQKLEDFDYFFYHLKENGIYTNINLLTGRETSSLDGLPKEIDKVRDWKSRHCLGFWNKEAQQLQKDYAQELLSHINPYTKKSYLEDPAVAIIEVNNENGMLMAYLTNWLEDYQGKLWQDLEDKWNDWLQQKGYSYEILDDLYNYKQEINNILINENSSWNLEQHETAKATLKKNGNSHTIQINNNGNQNWHVQYGCPNLNISEEKIYTIRFKAKSSESLELSVGINQAHSPWKGSWERKITVTQEEQEFTFTVSGLLTDPNLRLIFSSMGFLEGKAITLSDISLVEGGELVNVEAGTKTSKTKTTVKLPTYQEYTSIPKEYKNLILNFFYDIEENYWTMMCDFLKKELKSKSLIMGTALGCTTHHLMDCFDIIDSHAYWNHPSFPNTAWNQHDYYVDNKDLTKEINSNTLLNLSKYRVYGKPFCVSEYDHPYPNQYSSQMYPMLASFACFQDWDLIFTFCDSIPSKNNGQNEKIKSFFDQGNNPAKSCAAPLAARIFRNFMVKPAETSIYEPLSKEKERAILYKNSGWNIGNTQNFNVDPCAALIYKLGITFDEPPTNSKLCTEITKELEQIKSDVNNPNKGIFSETNEIYWNTNTGTYIVCNENVTISISNEKFILNQNIKNWIDIISSESLLPITDATDFATLMAIKENEKYILFTCSWSGNKDEGLKKYGEKSHSKKNKIIREEIPLTSKHDFGYGPALALGINGTILFKDNTKHTIYPLDLEGNPILKKKQNGKKLKITNDTSLWYVID